VYKKLVSIIIMLMFAVMSLAVPAFACSSGVGMSQNSLELVCKSNKKQPKPDKEKSKPDKEQPNTNEENTNEANTNEEQSNAGEQQPSTNEGQSNTDKEKSKPDKEQPKTDEEQPSTNEGQSTTNEEQSDTDEEQPEQADNDEPNFVPAPSVIKVDRVLIPVKSIERGLKAVITWDESLNLVVIEKDGDEIQIDLTNKTALVNGTTINLAKGKSSKARITVSTGLVKKLLKQAKSTEPVSTPVDAEKAKYETAVTIDNTVTQGTDVTALVKKLQAGQTADDTVTVTVTAVNAADGTSAASYLTLSDGTVTLTQQNTTGAPVTETVTITFTKEDTTTTLVVIVTIQ